MSRLNLTDLKNNIIIFITDWLVINILLKNFTIIGTKLCFIRLI
jgi:hypothetical protein